MYEICWRRFHCGLLKSQPSGRSDKAFGSGLSRHAAFLGLAAMFLSYVPTLAFFRLSKMWALTMPVVGTLYLAMTWTSAIRYWQGKVCRWKGRIYSKGEPAS